MCLWLLGLPSFLRTALVVLIGGNQALQDLSRGFEQGLSSRIIHFPYTLSRPADAVVEKVLDLDCTAPSDQSLLASLGGFLYEVPKVLSARTFLASLGGLLYEVAKVLPIASVAGSSLNSDNIVYLCLKSESCASHRKYLQPKS